ncbi:hypothetical protein ACFWE5_03830 [Cellulosimicrobium funkei]|uniref:hypothetical protein n=1 Tax=Cellulosimicrobium funkei TaxID=264251 RepID=UPI00364CDE3E
MTAPVNPDCRDGKHRACAGDAWDFDADQPDDCSCTCHAAAALAAAPDDPTTTEKGTQP